VKTRSVIIPAGDLWMRLAFEMFSQSVIKIAEQRGPLLKVTNPWYLIYNKEASDYLRIALLGGDLKGHYCDNDGVKEIPRRYWRRDVSEVALRDGEASFGGDQQEFVFADKESFLQLCDRYQSRDWPYGPSTSAPEILAEPAYTPPFMAMMTEAIQNFRIPTNAPKKSELIEFFLAQRLPDGSPVSRNHAEAMATFCRPVEAMKGGNKRVGS
jgi:hypothetical protein